MMEHLCNKDRIDEIMKSIAWAALSGSVFAMAMYKFRSGSFYEGYAVFFLFILASTITTIYVLLHVVTPFVSAVFPNNKHFSNEYRMKPNEKMLSYLRSALFSKAVLLYLAIGAGYFLYAHQVAEYLADKV